MCVFAAMIFFLSNGTWPLFSVILLSLFILCGIWAIVSSIFRLDADSTFSWIVGAIIAIGLAAFAFLIAWHETDFQVRGSISFIPAAWSQVAARISFAFGGLFALILAVACLRKAIKKHRKG